MPLIDFEAQRAARRSKPSLFADPVDVPGGPVQHHYTEPQLHRWEHYQGPLADMPEAEVRALLVQVLDYFDLDGSHMPYPPTGLPGARCRRHKWDEPEAELLFLGWDYFISAARRQPRAMVNTWERAREMVLALRTEGREHVFAEMSAKDDLTRAEADDKRNRQLVYFIGAQSGPIKIGMAINPAARLKTLQTSHHEKLEILATCEGGQPLEAAYHARFAGSRLTGEWFERTPEILSEIDRLNYGPDGAGAELL